MSQKLYISYVKANEPPAQYINAHTGIYIKLIIAICNGEIADNVVAATAILNHVNLALELKESYINLLVTTIDSLDTVNDRTLWPHLLSHHCIPCSKNNVLKYYFASENAFDEILTKFINTAQLESDLNYDDI